LLTRSRFGSLTFRQALATSQGTGSAIAFSLAILVVWPVTALLMYHARVNAVSHHISFLPGAD
jgi:palmitoyltransferase ZDHHC9/14/18